MLQIVKKKIRITGKGEVKTEQITLPNNAKRIVAVIVTNTSVITSAFPVAPPYTIPPTSPLSGTSTDTEIVSEILVAINAGTGYSKFDKVERKVEYVYVNGTLGSTTTTYTNLETNSDITASINVADLQVLNEELPYSEFGSSLSFAFSTTKLDYPYGLTLPTDYRSVIVSFEADATTLSADLAKIARIGRTTEVSSAIGTRVGEGARIELSKEEFEASSVIGLQAGKTHTVQVQILT
jgi:hypothetical protein